MLISIVAILLASGQSGCAISHDPDPAFRVKLCPLRLPRIRSVSIDRNGDHGLSWQGRKCAFRLNAATVRNYLTRGGTVTASEVDGALMNSPCKARGTIKFVDGRKATWHIESLGVGSLRIGDAEPIFTYCPDCGAPFDKQ